MESKGVLSNQALSRQLPTHYSTHPLFDANSRLILDELSLALCNPGSVDMFDKPNEALSSEFDTKLTVSESKFCNACQSKFQDRDEQLAHYKSDWHRYNLHLRLKGSQPVSEDYFDTVSGDVSSISGSDEEQETDSESAQSDSAIFNSELGGVIVNTQRNSHKLFFRNKDGDLLSVHRCLLHHKKSPMEDEVQITCAIKELPQKTKWGIFMVSSGHFAGAIFDKDKVLEHKTFHRYTVRKKRGTAQSSHDKKGGHAKSAGSHLRRYNEAALVQEVQELLSKWKDELSTCHLVFVRIPVANREMFFAGKNVPFKKDDSRIRVIPFPTRRPTFNELKRVQQMLACIECFGPAIDVGLVMPKSPQRFYDKDSNRLQVRPPTSKVHSDTKAAPVDKEEIFETDDASELSSNSRHQSNDETGDQVDMDLVEEMEQIDFSHLKEFDNTPIKKATKKKKDNLMSKIEDFSLDEREIRWRNSLFTASKTGNENIFSTILNEMIVHHKEGQKNEGNKTSPDRQMYDLPLGSITKDKNDQENITVTVDQGNITENVVTTTESSKGDLVTYQIAEFINRPLGDGGQTLLHVASKEGHNELVRLLMENGADPACKDKTGKRPYNLGTSETRNAFRRFMCHWPDRYNYVDAQVPSPLSEEMEAEKKRKIAEKRKAKKKAANERNKDKKAAEVALKEEEREKQRYLALSDREKRALAAERRILQQHDSAGSSKPVLSRCYACAADMTGKVPFEYSDFKFCSTKCLREHRSNNAKR